MKRFIQYVGLILIISGLVLLGMYCYSNYKIQKDVENLAESTKIVNDGEQVDTSNSTGDLILSQETYTEDQKAKKVKNYVSVLEIPKFEVLAYIYDEITKVNMDYGVCRYENSVKVGENGNCAITGHSSDIYNCILNPVKDMKLLDMFYAYDSKGGRHTYYITEKKVVTPDSYYVTETTDDSHSYMTIITCTQKGTMRLVLVGEELNDAELTELRHSLQSDSYSTMVKVNDSLSSDVRVLDSILNNNSNLHLKEYYVRVSSKLVKSCKNYDLYLGYDRFPKKKHKFNSKFNTDIGVKVKFK